MVTFHCANCGKGLRVKDELAGKRVKCPGCGEAVTVPAEPVAVPAGAPADQPQTPPVKVEEERPAPTGNGQAVEPAPRETIDADVLVKTLQERKPGGPWRDLVIEGDVEIDSCNYPFPLVVEGCVFKGRFHAAGALFGKTVVLRRCVFEDGANFEGAQVTGKLVLTGSTFGTPENTGRVTVFRLLRVAGDVSSDGVTTHGDLDFNGCKIDGDIDLQGTHVHGSLNLQVAQISGGLWGGPLPGADEEPRPLCVEGWTRLGGAKVQGAVDFEAAHIQEDLAVVGAEIRCGLWCRKAEVGGNLFLQAARVSYRVDAHGLQVGKELGADGAKIEGELELSRTTVGGTVRLNSIEVAGPLRLEGANVTGDVLLFRSVIKGGLSCGPEDEHPLEVKGDLALSAAQISGEARFNQAHIQGHLRLDDAAIDGNLFCFNLDHGRPDADKAQEKSNVVLARAQISGAVHFDGAHLLGALVLECAEIRGGFFCRPTDREAVIEGDLLLPAARVAGAVNLSGARVVGGLNLHGATITGDLICQPQGETPTRFEGDAHLASVEVTGQMDLRQVQFAKNLNMVSARVGGNLFAPRCQVGPDKATGKEAGEVGEVNMVLLKVAGIVYLSGTHIAGSLNLSGAEIGVGLAFGIDEEQAPRVGGPLELQSCQIKSVELDGGICPDGTIKLNGARLGSLEFEHRLPPALDMEGLEFQTLTVPRHGDQRDYVGLLRATQPFDQSTYVTMESWLRNRGAEDEADRVYRDMRRRQRRELTRDLRPLSLRGLGRWSRRLLSLAWDSFIYVAVKLSTALVLYFIVALVATAWLFANPAAVVIKESPSRTTKPEDWNGIRAVAMSLQINLPLVPIHAVENWRPSDKSLPGLGAGGYTYADYADVVGLVSSLAVAFLAGSISNKLSRRKATES